MYIILLYYGFLFLISRSTGFECLSTTPKSFECVECIQSCETCLIYNFINDEKESWDKIEDRECTLIILFTLINTRRIKNFPKAAFGSVTMKAWNFSLFFFFFRIVLIDWKEFGTNLSTLKASFFPTKKIKEYS